MIRRLLLLVALCCSTVRAAEYAIPSDRVPPSGVWTANAVGGAGIPGGIPTTRAGGTVNVKSAPYYAAGNDTETTGTISNGSTSLVVASATDFAVGNPILVGYSATVNLSVTAGCSSSGNVTITLGDNSTTANYVVAVTSGDTTTQVATKIRSATFANGRSYDRWTTSGTGTNVVFTRNNFDAQSGPSIAVASTGVTGSWTTVHSASVGIGLNTPVRITNIAGTTITVDTACSGSFTDARVVHEDAWAIDECLIAANGLNKVVYIPAGTYRMDGGTAVLNNTTFRGDLAADGFTPTSILKYYAATGTVVGMNSGVSDWTSPNAAVTGSPQKGDNVIHYTGGALTDGYLNEPVRFTLLNNRDPDDLVFSVSGYERVKAQICLITAVAEDFSTITISPPLMFDLPASLSPTVSAPPAPPRKDAGVENIKIDSYNSTSPTAAMVFQNTLNCWAYKVHVVGVYNYNCALSKAFQCEIRMCEFRERQFEGTNGGALLPAGCSQCLYIDNILGDQFPTMEANFGNSGNVYAYNFMFNSDVFGVIGGSLNSNHGPHNTMNLFEGNVAPKRQSDGIFGSESYATDFRNWYHGTSGPGGRGAVGYRIAVTLNRGSYGFSFVGNQLGTTVNGGAGLTWEYMNTGAGWTTTSTTSITPGFGTHVFTVDAGLSWRPDTEVPGQDAGNRFLAVSRSDPTSYLTGWNTQYSGTTLTVTAFYNGSGGAKSDWDIYGWEGYDTPTIAIYRLAGPNIGSGGQGGNPAMASPRLGVWWRCWPDGMQMVRPNGGGNTPYSGGASASGIVRSGTTATVTTNNAHNYKTGAIINISGADVAAYNGNFAITETGTHTFTYTVVGSPAQPGGSIDTAPVFTTGNVVERTAAGPSGMVGDSVNVISWLAYNPSKDGTATWDTPSASSTDWLPISNNSFQDIDNDVPLTFLKKGNWNARDVGVSATESLGGDTLPTSLFTASKPVWFGTLTWPAYGPESPNQSFTAIPAGWRYTNGNLNYLESGATATVSGTTSVTNLTVP